MEDDMKKYIITDSIVLNYISRMDYFCEYAGNRLKYDIYNDEDFNRDEAVKFIRTWDIIKNDLSPANRCLYLVFMAYDCDAEISLEVFNKCGGCAGNIFSLRTMTQRIKKRIISIYKDKYGL